MIHINIRGGIKRCHVNSDDHDDDDFDSKPCIGLWYLIMKIINVYYVIVKCNINNCIVHINNSSFYLKDYSIKC